MKRYVCSCISVGVLKLAAGISTALWLVEDKADESLNPHVPVSCVNILRELAPIGLRHCSNPRT